MQKKCAPKRLARDFLPESGPAWQKIVLRTPYGEDSQIQKNHPKKNNL
jgi:hypothetical protein